MNRKEKLKFWRAGAKRALKELHFAGKEEMKEVALKWYNAPGMRYVWHDDWWARGYVAMLKRKAGMKNYEY
jgi:hypothetical protein